jgi:peptidoglycan-associated lipoprotein
VLTNAFLHEETVMKLLVRVLMMAFVAWLAAGCSTAPKKEGAAPVTGPGVGATTQGAGGQPGVGGAEVGATPWREAPEGRPGEAVGGPDSPWSSRVIYFDFDSSQVRDEFRPILQAQATYLSAHPSARVVLEGHTDERGSREYNLGLGERRAQAVRQILLVLGVSAQQMQVVSYGKEKPAAVGHNEEAWRMNRRVEIVYSGS